MNIYRLIKDYIYSQIHETPYIYNVKETVEKIVQDKVSISRFGDGEFDLMLEINHPKFQNTDKHLKEMLLKTFLYRDNKIIICIPDVFTYNKYKRFTLSAAKHWAKFVMNNRKKLYKIIDFQYKYGDSLFTRQYIDLKDKSKTDEYYFNVKRIWDDRNVVIVEGRYTRFGVNNDLLDNARSVRRILCPEKDAFNKYKEILKACLKQEPKTLFLVALGPTATVMTVDLAFRGFQAIDIGHLDIEYEWFLKKASKKEVVANKYVNEVDEDINLLNYDFKDKQYRNSIICHIK